MKNTLAFASAPERSHFMSPTQLFRTQNQLTPMRESRSYTTTSCDVNFVRKQSTPLKIFAYLSRQNSKITHTADIREASTSRPHFSEFADQTISFSVQLFSHNNSETWEFYRSSAPSRCDSELDTSSRPEPNFRFMYSENRKNIDFGGLLPNK